MGHYGKPALSVPTSAANWAQIALDLLLNNHVVSIDGVTIDGATFDENRTYWRQMWRVLHAAGVPPPPTLPAYGTPGGRQLVIFCPDCRRPHFHGSVGPRFGAGDGHRWAHCTGDGVLREIGYILKEAPGEIPPEYRRR